jgi:predicted nucleic acid-binding protein
LRVFFDTNVLVSAFASRGLCAELFGASVLREFAKALRRKIKLPARRVEQIVEFVAGEAAQTIAEAAPVTALKVDPDDALVLGEALAGRADIFVTGDAALLRTETVESLRIVSPRRFWEVLRSP